MATEITDEMLDMAGKGEEDTLSEFKAQIDDAVPDQKDDDIGADVPGQVRNIEPEDEKEATDEIPAPPGMEAKPPETQADSALLAELKELRKEMAEMKSGQTQAQKAKDREAEKAKLATALGNLNYKYQQALEGGNVGEATKLMNQITQVSSKAAIVDWEEKQEEAKAQAEPKQETPNQQEIPQAAKNWLAQNPWMNDPKYHQWRAYAEGIATKYINEGNDANSPLLYVAVENELKAHGFVKPGTSAPNVVPMRKSGGQPVKPTGSKPGRGKVVKLDRERAELANALDLGEDPEVLKAYKNIVEAKKSKGARK